VRVLVVLGGDDALDASPRSIALALAEVGRAASKEPAALCLLEGFLALGL